MRTRFSGLTEVEIHFYLQQKKDVCNVFVRAPWQVTVGRSRRIIVSTVHGIVPWIKILHASIHRVIESYAQVT